MATSSKLSTQSINNISLSLRLYIFHFFMYMYEIKKNIMTEFIFLGSFPFYLMVPLISSNLSSTQLQ